MRLRAAGILVVMVTLVGACRSGGNGAPPRPLVWAAMGDSYSAGIGGPGPIVSSAGCPQDHADAFSTLALADLASALPHQSFDQRFVACGGATTAEVTSTQLSAAHGADVASLTIGGNDLGFVQVVTRCIVSGCASYDRPDDDLPALRADPGRTEWQTLTDRLTATFVAIRQTMAADGWLYVLSYPIPAPERLGPTCPSGAAPLKSRDIVLADAMALRLGDAVDDAVDHANEELTPTRAGHVVFVDWRVASGTPVRETRTIDSIDHEVAFNPDGLCTAEPIINGIATTELGDSFHPTARGAAIAGQKLAEAIARNVG